MSSGFFAASGMRKRAFSGFHSRLDRVKSDRLLVEAVRPSYAGSEDSIGITPPGPRLLQPGKNFPPDRKEVLSV